MLKKGKTISAMYEQSETTDDGRYVIPSRRANPHGKSETELVVKPCTTRYTIRTHTHTPGRVGYNVIITYDYLFIYLFIYTCVYKQTGRAGWSGIKRGITRARVSTCYYCCRRS